MMTPSNPFKVVRWRHRKWRRLTVLLSLLWALLIAISCQGNPPPLESLGPGEATATCPEVYDPSQDAFPDKIHLDYALGFAVEYHPHYKVVTVNTPWKAADRSFQYLLVQCGAPIPEGFDQAQLIEIPIDSVVSLSTTHLPHLDLLNQVDALIGVGQFNSVNTPSVRHKIDQGELKEFNAGNQLNLEQLVVAQPDLVMTFATGNAETDQYSRLMQAGIPVALVAEYLEESPLGRAEWLKFTALFFNQEAQAQEAFATIAADYETMVQLAQTETQRPTVFTGFSYDGTWYMPGGNSYVAQLLHDAGADYLWAEIDQAGSIPMDFEAVYNRAATADFWVNVSQDWQTQQDAIAADPRYGEFTALQQNQVFNNNARLNDSGGNDYWESGTVNPHWVLADLIKIFHPELLPDHRWRYYQPLQP